MTEAGARHIDGSGLVLAPAAGAIETTVEVPWVFPREHRRRP